MSRKSTIVDKMSMHFAEVGKVQTLHEYVRSGGGPISVPAIKSSCGSWARMVRICNSVYPDRMGLAKGVTTAPEEVKAPEPPKKETSEGVKTASEALAKLRGADE